MKRETETTNTKNHRYVLTGYDISEAVRMMVAERYGIDVPPSAAVKVRSKARRPLGATVEWTESKPVLRENVVGGAGTGEDVGL